jgi:hypothetical protein
VYFAILCVVKIVHNYAIQEWYEQGQAQILLPLILR